MSDAEVQKMTESLIGVRPRGSERRTGYQGLFSLLVSDERMSLLERSTALLQYHSLSDSERKVSSNSEQVRIRILMVDVGGDAPKPVLNLGGPVSDHCTASTT